MSCTCDMRPDVKRCHCRACCLTFSGIRAFDLHLAGTLTGGAHKSPAEAGLVQVYPRVWGRAGGEWRRRLEAS